MWLAFGLIFALYAASSAMADILLRVPSNLLTPDNLWKIAAQLAFGINLFMPVIAGISAADRLVRDRQLGVDELLHSTALKWRVYLAGKYAGVLLSVLLPVLLVVLCLGLIQVVRGAPVELLGMCLAAFLGISLPAVAFVTAFSLAVPTVMPLRVYQVLFTGYWFWGNYLNPSVFPTIAGSLLTANGRIVLEGWFGGYLGSETGQLTFNSSDAFVNLALLAFLAAAALGVAGRVMALRAARA
jgi:ABC-type transport system involved in multi-copper enzyme maturation permease subunit